MTTNPALEAPLTEIPHTLVGITAMGKLYYWLFPTEPGAEEYTAAGAAITLKIGAKPVEWIYRPSVEIRWAEIQLVLESEPVRVS